jgi:hypothetical protein
LIFFQSLLHLSWSAVAENLFGSVSQRLPFKVHRGFASIRHDTGHNTGQHFN